MSLFGDNNQDLTITVKAKDEASAKLNTFSASLTKLTGAVALGNIAADAIANGMRMMTGVVSGSVQAWQQQENAMAQTEAVLKSTGGAAGMSADELYKLSSALQSTTTYGDEAILGAENLLLTFTSIGKDIFPAATQTVLDMSTALGQDLKSSAIQLGKALQDPVLGVTALRRVGINFNEAQQEVIANLVKTGQSAKAQQLIMAELAREFGGSATAAAKTFQGQMQQVKNKIGDVQETIGRGLTGAISSALVAFNRTTGAMESNVDVSKKLFNVMAFVTETTATVAVGIHALAGGFVITTSYIGQAIAMLNGFDEAEKVFWSSFRENVAQGIAASMEFAVNLKEQNAQTRADWDKVTAASAAMGQSAPAAYEAAGNAASEAAKKIQEANRAVADTQVKIKELMESNEQNNASIQQRIADEIVKQQYKVHDLKVQIAEGSSSKNLSILRDEYEKEKEALERMSSLKVALSEQVTESKRRHALTEFERQVEDLAAQLVRDNAAYQKKLATLQQELKDNEMKRAALAANEQGITADVKVELGKRDAAVKASVDNQVKQYQRLSLSAPKAPSLMDIATMGLTSVSTKKVNDAIITPSGQVIETHPDDYLIATKTPGGMGGNITVNINNPTVRSDSDLAAMKRLVDDAMRGLMVNNKLTTA